MKNLKRGVVVPIVLAFVGLVAVVSGIVYYGNKSIEHYETEAVNNSLLLSTTTDDIEPWMTATSTSSSTADTTVLDESAANTATTTTIGTSSVIREVSTSTSPATE